MHRHYLFGGGNSYTSKLKLPHLLAGGIGCLVSPWDLPPFRWHDIYKKELEEAEKDMIQAYLEKSRLEKEEAEIIKQRTLKAQKEFEALEQKRGENRRINEKMREEILKNGAGSG